MMTREQVLETIRKCKKNGRDAVSIKQFIEETGLSLARVHRYYNYWNDAVRDAGLRPLDVQGWVPTPVAELRKKLIQRVRRFAKEWGTKTVDFENFRNFMPTHERWIEQAFGTWSAYLRAAGLRGNHKRIRKWRDRHKGTKPVSRRRAVRQKK